MRAFEFCRLANLVDVFTNTVTMALEVRVYTEVYGEDDSQMRIILHWGYDIITFSFDDLTGLYHLDVQCKKDDIMESYYEWNKAIEKFNDGSCRIRSTRDVESHTIEIKGEFYKMLEFMQFTTQENL